MSEIGEALLLHLGNFGDLASEDADAIRTMGGTVRLFEREHDIFREGDRPDEVIVPLRGMLHRYTSRRDGRRQIHGLHFPTEGLLDTLQVGVMDHNVAALVDSRVGFIPVAALREAMSRSTRLLGLLWRQTIVQGSIFRAWLMRNSSQPAHAAMAHLFCEALCRAQAAGLTDDHACDLPVTQEILGDALGISVVHASRSLQVLRQTGAVDFGKGRLTVRDQQRLADIADFEPAYLHLVDGECVSANG